MTSPVILNIAGVDYLTTQQDSFSIKSVVGQTIATMDATIYDKNCSLTIPEGVDIIITRGDTGERIFGGLVGFVTDWTEGISRYFQVQGQSYTVLLDRFIVYAHYQPGYSDTYILNDLCTTKVVGVKGETGNACEIVIGSYVKSGIPALGTLTFTYSYLREAVELLANIVGYNYYVDFNKNLHYYFKESETSPFGLSSSSNGTSTIGYRNLKRKRDATRVINNFVVFGATATADPRYGYVGANGSDKIISVAFQGPVIPLYAPGGLATIGVWINTGTDAVPNWVSQTVGNTGTDPATVNCLYDSTALTLTFAVAPPAHATNSIEVYYTFPYGAGMTKSLPASIAQYGRILSNKLVVSDANSALTMKSKLDNLAAQFGSALHSLTLTVDDGAFPVGNTNRFKAGQWVTLVNSGLGINKNFMIYSITTKCIGGLLKSYDLELRSWSLE